MARTLDPRVSIDARATRYGREWLNCNGYGGAYGGTASEVRTALDNFYPGGWDSIREYAVIMTKLDDD